MKICKLQQGNIIHTTRGNFIKDKNGILHVWIKWSKWSKGTV